MKALKWIGGGVAGGAVGAAIWAAVAYFLNMEWGWIAWAVGALAGLGVRAAASTEACAQSGVVAAIVAVLSIFAGKYAVVEIAVSQIAFAETFTATPETGIASIASEIAAEKQARGETIEWPALDETAADRAPSPEESFPPHIWTMAKSRWQAMSPQEQEARLVQSKHEIAQAMQMALGVVRGVGFLASFSLFDLLWCFFAIGSAYKLGSGQAAS